MGCGTILSWGIFIAFAVLVVSLFVFVVTDI